MKKFLLSSLALMGIAASAFAGDGSEANPFTVEEVVAMGNDVNLEGKYVQGYIVGSIPEGAASTVLQYTTFTAEGASNYNLVLADSSGERDYRVCMPVQLSSSVRDALSVAQNPDNIFHEVKLLGNLIKYCGAPGMKDTSAYEWIGTAPTPGGGSTGGGNNSGSTGSGYLSANMDDFTIQDVTLSGELSYVWTWDASYHCAKASAYANNTNYAAESYIISPEISLPADVKSATFEQAVNFVKAGQTSDYLSVCIREGNGAWTALAPSAWPAGSDWTFITAQIDLSAYAGKTVQIGFRYTSTAESACTWEVKNLEIGGKATDTPANPTEVLTVAQALEKIAGGFTGQAQVKGYVSAIKEISTEYGNATYTLVDDMGNTANGLGVYRGYYLNGDKFTSSDQLKVGDLLVVSGELVNYMNNTPQFTTGSKIVSINGEGNGGNGGNTGGDEPGELRGETVTFNFTVPSSLGAGFSDEGETGTGVDIPGTTLTSGPVSIEITNNGGSTEPRLWNSSGNWTFRFYKDNIVTVSVEEGLYLTGVVFEGNNIGTDWTWSNGSLASSTWTPKGDVEAVSFSKTATGNTVSIKTMTVYYSDESGVESVLAADDSQAVYFNLQGQRVANPDRGIFIKVAGGKAVKVLK